ncbi:Cytochrome P450 monooxygenase virE [Psilocybe cubensis]|uniref:Cytochrome P450 monooxygenase virE n=2 Tax=Psilocybe cubensis TaxID=181762 RepID=A0ACB8GHE6_PSICU|nr:Cytochrome P450 monooxygenase virE [Psilocybe cubensis]KAH9475128.1 Cytochrome P450 monooxygenase virE [Psilocybe cubensis]
MSFTGSVTENLLKFLGISSLLLLAYFCSPVVLRHLIVDYEGNRLPPGPPVRYAFLRKYAERALDAWAKQYGSMFSIWMGSQLFVVISDPVVAKDLLVTNGAIFSSRKKYFMKNQIILKGRAITASEYGNKWRQHRRLAALALNPKAMEGYASVMDYESHILIKSLYDESQQGKSPVNPAHFAGRFALNNMLIMSFGLRTTSSYDPLVAKALGLAMEFMDLTGPWSNCVDFFEILQYLPSQKRSRGQKLHDDLIKVYGGMILNFKSRMLSGENVPDCLVKTLLETQESEKLDWEDLCMLSAVFTLGGVHSTSGIIQWFLALIPSHREVLERAQLELDQVIGRGRWPCLEDEASLPFTRAIIKEVQRVHAPFWFATPHCSSQDFTYKGTFIPKNTVVLLNCFTLHHNESRYPEPLKFNPERYINDKLSCSESAKLANVMDRDHWAFGAGRRICPGLPAAERELWLAISRLLWSFDFNALPDEPISLEEYDGLSGRTPLPYRLRLTPRFEGVVDIINAVEETTL